MVSRCPERPSPVSTSRANDVGVERGEAQHRKKPDAEAAYMHPLRLVRREGQEKARGNVGEAHPRSAVLDLDAAGGEGHVYDRVGLVETASAALSTSSMRGRRGWPNGRAISSSRISEEIRRVDRRTGTLSHAHRLERRAMQTNGYQLGERSFVKGPSRRQMRRRGDSGRHASATLNESAPAQASWHWAHRMGSPRARPRVLHDAIEW